MSLLEYSKTHVPTYPQFVEIWTAHEDLHWVLAEVNLSSDVEDWKTGKATSAETALIKNILRLFTTSDFIVGASYYDRLIPVIKNSEARMMLGSFAAAEATHVMAYALLSDTLGFGEDFYLEFLDYAEMSEKVEFMSEAMDDSIESFIHYIGKQTLIEGVNLFASFAVLFNFDRFGAFPGMTDVVRWSVVQEGIHVEGNSLLFRELVQEHPQVVNDEFKKSIYDLARYLVEIEDAFVDKAFEFGEVRGVTPDEIKQYVRYITDIRLGQLGFKPNWNVEKNPIPWIDELVVDSHGNFFERSIMYSNNSLSGDVSSDLYGSFADQWSNTKEISGIS